MHLLAARFIRLECIPSSDVPATYCCMYSIHHQHIQHLRIPCQPASFPLTCAGLCPSGNAWVDHATGNNTAHAALTECSNMGVCDRTTGICSCRSGFTGEACQRLACQDDCNGRGRCMSMRDAAAVIDGDSLEFEGVYDGWDADMIHGCLCDEGWEGYDCSLR